MTDILGAIDASISLAERLRSFVNSYAGAEEAAATMRLFDGQLETMRLKTLASRFEQLPKQLRQ